VHDARVGTVKQQCSKRRRWSLALRPFLSFAMEVLVRVLDGGDEEPEGIIRFHRPRPVTLQESADALDRDRRSLLAVRPGRHAIRDGEER